MLPEPVPDRDCRRPVARAEGGRIPEAVFGVARHSRATAQRAKIKEKIAAVTGMIGNRNTHERGREVFAKTGDPGFGRESGCRV